MRRSLVAVLVGFLVVSGLQVQPANAASKKPSKVGLVSFVKADYDRKTNRTSLSLDWPDARNAKKYEIFVSRSYSMKHAKKYQQKSSKTTIKKLVRGTDYFFQVRGVNGKKHGSKSTTVARTTILRPGAQSNLMPLRILTYNVCSRVCDDNGYPWISRQASVQERITTSGADIAATQEADNLFDVPGYTLAVEFSAKKLWYNAARFAVVAAPAPTTPAPTTPAPTTPTPTPTTPSTKPASLGTEPGTGCRLSSDPTQHIGNIYLGHHGGGCRYAVWADLVERSTGRTFTMVDIHTVSGSTKTATDNRRDEINLVIATIKGRNTGLPTLYAGDFNSHKQTKTSDSVRPLFNKIKFYDAFDQARKVTGQHISSYNGFHSAPKISTKWGDHLDKVWVDPWKTRVDGWANLAVITPAGKMLQPIPSDHSPVVVDLRVG